MYYSPIGNFLPNKFNWDDSYQTLKDWELKQSIFGTEKKKSKIDNNMDSN